MSVIRNPSEENLPPEGDGRVAIWHGMIFWIAALIAVGGVVNAAFEHHTVRVVLEVIGIVIGCLIILCVVGFLIIAGWIILAAEKCQEPPHADR